MRWLLAAMICAALAFSAVAMQLSPSSSATISTSTAYDADIDHNGKVEYGDFLILLEFWNQWTPACAPSVHYDPPEPVYDAAGTTVGLVVNRLWIPTEHPAYTANMMGTPVDVRPC